LNDADAVPEPDSIERHLDEGLQLPEFVEFNQELATSSIAISIQDINDQQEDLLKLDDELPKELVKEEENKEEIEEEEEAKELADEELIEVTFIVKDTTIVIENEASFTVQSAYKMAEDVILIIFLIVIFSSMLFLIFHILKETSNLPSRKTNLNGFFLLM
jgi:flagellar motor protein MotB